MNGDADDGPADDRQIQGRIPMAHPTAVFSSNDVEPLVQAIFNAPVVAIRTEHLLGVHLRRRARGEQKLYFGFLGRLARNVDTAGESSRLFCKGKVDAAGADLKGAQATFFGTPSVDLRGLGAGRCVLRGKRRATDLDGAVARSSPLRAGCL